MKSYEGFSKDVDICTACPVCHEVVEAHVEKGRIGAAVRCENCGAESTFVLKRETTALPEPDSPIDMLKRIVELCEKAPAPGCRTNVRWDLGWLLPEIKRTLAAHDKSKESDA